MTSAISQSATTQNTCVPLATTAPLVLNSPLNMAALPERTVLTYSSPQLKNAPSARVGNTATDRTRPTLVSVKLGAMHH